MRNFDNYNQITDNEGNLLVGKLVFCRKGTTEQETIYSWDSEHNEYVAINPEVLININGRPDTQVFLKDTDYTIYVFKYIGNGEMDQDSDENNWLAQYSFNNLYLTFGVDIKSDSPYLVSTMAELGTTDPANVGLTQGKTLVCLGGYNALGDCPPVIYYWDETNTQTSNGVDVVAVTGISIGRWLLVNTFTETGFDVRHTGCFAEKTAAETSISQSYAIQRADTYALKYGLKIVFPDLYSDTYSYYLLTNLIVNSEVVVADGVKLLTATSATLNFVSEENLKKKVPFVLHDATYNGTWTLKGETIRTGYFENQESLSNTNWPPTITANKKYIYDASFNCYGTTPNISLSGKEVVFDLLLENEIYTLTNCKIESLGKIKKPCSFTNCDIKGSFFDPSLTNRQFADFLFSSCNSNLESWDSVNKYVVFKIIQDESSLDLQGKTCSLDWSSYGGGLYYPFPFMRVSNAVFSSITTFPTDQNGTNKPFFYLDNVSMLHLEIHQDSTLISFEAKDSNIAFDKINSGTLPNCVLKAENCKLSNDGLSVKEFTLLNCDVSCTIEIDTSASVVKAVVKNCIVRQHIIVGSNSTYNIVFDGNTITNNAVLWFAQTSGSDHSFVNTSICNNNVSDGPREFVYNADSNWNYSNIGNYEYKNNTGTLKAEDSIKLALRIPWYSLGATIPSGTKRYLQQIALNSNYCALFGVSINDIFFSFGEETQRDIFVTTNPICSYAYSSSFILSDYESGTRINQGNYLKVLGCNQSILLRKGVPVSNEVFDGSNIVVEKDGMSDGDLCSLVLIAEKVYRADAYSEIIK